MRETIPGGRCAQNIHERGGKCVQYTHVKYKSDQISREENHEISVDGCSVQGRAQMIPGRLLIQKTDS